jgi:hypothetical protein
LSPAPPERWRETRCERARPDEDFPRRGPDERSRYLDELATEIWSRPERMRRLLETARAWQCPRCGETTPVPRPHCAEEEDPYCYWLVFTCRTCGEVIDEEGEWLDG